MKSLPKFETERDENGVPIAPKLDFTLPPIPDTIEVTSPEKI